MNRLSLALIAASSDRLARGLQSQGVPSSDTLKLGAYSVVREVFHDGLIPAFAARWKKQDRPRRPVRGVVQRLRRPGPVDRLGL